jgi:hypothetical protein
MAPIDDHDLDERLGRLAEPDPAAVDRVVRAALAVDSGGAGLSFRFVAIATSLAVVVAALGAWHWTRRPAPAPFLVEAGSDVVLVLAPDGSSLIFDTGPREDEPPPGTGYIIAGGDAR